MATKRDGVGERPYVYRSVKNARATRKVSGFLTTTLAFKRVAHMSGASS